MGTDMHDINALSLLGISADNANEYSVRLNNVMPHYDPWTSQSEDMFDHLFGCRWNNEQHRRLIHGPKVLQFLQLHAGSPLFVFMGCFEVDKEPINALTHRIPLHDEFPDFEFFEWRPRGDGRPREVEALKPYARRLVIRFVRKPGFKFQRMDFDLSNESYALEFLGNMTVEYIRSSPYELQPFPGYANVCLSHPELVRAVQDEGWQVALNNVQAVYLQTDTSNGWHYVGSAYSQNGEHVGLLSRWRDYAGGDHTGGNALLKKIPHAKDHIERYFQYSILEVFDMKTDAKEIVAREHWWMNALSSIRKGEDEGPGGNHPHGYNSF